MDKFQKKYDTYKDIFFYAVFGVITTIVNICSYWLLAHVFMLDIMKSTMVAWILAVFLAFYTNRKWVFHSVVVSTIGIIKEMSAFFVCRFFTGIVDVGCMYLCVEIFYLNDVYIKIFSNILVIILNYIASRLLIFKKK